VQHDLVYVEGNRFEIERQIQRKKQDKTHQGGEPISLHGRDIVGWTSLQSLQAFTDPQNRCQPLNSLHNAYIIKQQTAKADGGVQK
jgi:hypothetical protein